MADDEDPRLRLAYDEAMRTFAIQRDDLERLRSRVVTLVSVAALTAGLSGGTFLSHDHPVPGAWLYAPLSAFGVLIICVCLILAPRSMTFEADSRDILSGYVDQDLDQSATLRWLAYYAGAEGAANKEVLDRLHRIYLVAVIALGVSVILFLLALTHHT